LKYFCLSFDLEEFDIPKEIGKDINKEESFKISLEGTKKILDLLKKHNIKATFFVTTEFYRKYPQLIKEISKTHEIACHGEHDKDYGKISENESFKSVKQNMLLLKKGIKKNVIGFRAPRMSSPQYKVLKKAGLKYDASLHPTYVPRRYNHMFSPRKVFKREEITIIPTSVTPILRLPITWLWFRNLGLSYSKMCTRLCFLTDSYVSIYFHPWEFVSLSKLNIPTLFKRNTGEALCNKLRKYIIWLVNKNVNFVTLGDIAKKLE